ncbi:MAG: NAD(P)H-dependent oxidoreductase [Leptospirales bacterium]
MQKVLIIFAHPALQGSRINRSMIEGIERLKGITFHDLYELYPRSDIDIKHEQKLLLEHQFIIFQHPFYWYSMPPLLKEWIDLVLEHGWAYGSTGKSLAGKKAMSIITTGGKQVSYQNDGFNRYTMTQLLAPMDQTAFLCKMEYFPPYVIHGTHQLSDEEVQIEAEKYKTFIQNVRDQTFNFTTAAKVNPENMNQNSRKK